MKFSVITIFPQIINANLELGIVGKAIEKGKIKVSTNNPRDYSKNLTNRVDDKPFGGGSGMLLKPDILAKSIDKNTKPGERIYYLSPKGKKFDQNLAQKHSKEKYIVDFILYK